MRPSLFSGLLKLQVYKLKKKSQLEKKKPQKRKKRTLKPRMSKAPLMPSEVDILKTKAANKKGAGSEEVETVWPKPEFVCHASLLRSRIVLSLRPFFFPCRVVCVRG